MPSAANTALPRYLLCVHWRDGRVQRTPMRYHEHITIGPVDGEDRGTLQLGPRDNVAKVYAHLRGDECPAIALVDLARGMTPGEWLAKQRQALRLKRG